MQHDNNSNKGQPGLDYIKIRQATKKGYIEMINGGVCDLSYPTSKLRRGRVQRGGNTAPTITTGGNAIYVIYRKEVDVNG